MPEIVTAHSTDLAEILALQKLCYRMEAAIYGDYSIQPLTQTEAEIGAEFQSKTVLKTVENGKIIGSIRANEMNGTCHVGKVIVHPEFQNRGLGGALLLAIEKHLPNARRFELFTGFRSEKNLYLYGKNGYRKFKEEKVNDSFSLVYLEKNHGWLG
jgi:ribosomal protein S18 acetylase RimI-like enzyme